MFESVIFARRSFSLPARECEEWLGEAKIRSGKRKEIWENIPFTLNRVPSSATSSPFLLRYALDFVKVIMAISLDGEPANNEVEADNADVDVDDVPPFLRAAALAAAMKAFVCAAAEVEEVLFDAVADDDVVADDCAGAAALRFFELWLLLLLLPLLVAPAAIVVVDAASFPADETLADCDAPAVVFACCVARFASGFDVPEVLLPFPLCCCCAFLLDVVAADDTKS